MVKILAFDTETSDRAPYIPGTTTWIHSKKLLSIKDLKKEKSIWSSLLVKWPHIIQLAYILYDTENPGKSKIFNKYIDIEEDVIISAESLAIHHISQDKIQKMESKDRSKIQDALSEFLKDVKEADVVVGHNVAFDRKMIVSELLRLTKEKPNKDTDDANIIEMMNDKKFKCTQEITRPICKLKTKNKKGPEYYKFKTPKLIEAYEHFFGCISKQELLHDALIDAIITLRVYCISLDKNSFDKNSFDKNSFDKNSFDKNPFDKNPFDINHTNKTITSYIKKISPTKCKTVTKKRKITRRTRKLRPST
jgi:DNA polymerase-3 subunit epsilon